MAGRRTWLKALVLGPPALLLLLVGGPGIWLLWLGVLVVPSVWRGRWRWRLTALLLTPLAVMAGGFLGGVAGYATGRGRFMRMGLPGAGYFNLDPVTRAPRTSGGCVVLGSEFLTMLPNNAALRLLGWAFGPMPGSYRGPYPSREEAAALLAGSGQPVDPAELEQGRLRWGGRSYAIEPGTVRQLSWRLPDEPPGPARAAVVGDRLAVIETRGRIGLASLDGHGLVATYFSR